MIKSNSWPWRAISPSPAPTSPSLTSGNFYSCHMLSQMTQLSFQLPSQHPTPCPSVTSRLSPIFSLFLHQCNGGQNLPAARPTPALNHNQIAGQPSSVLSLGLHTKHSLAIRQCFQMESRGIVKNSQHIISQSRICYFQACSMSLKCFTNVHLIDILLLFGFSSVSGASSKIIKLQEGPSDYSDPPKGKIPAVNSTLVPVKGISNLGNTCFFNAVMQVCIIMSGLKP